MDAFCLFENGKSYTALQIAKRFGVNGDSSYQVRWVREQVFQQGCNFLQIGQKYYATGDAINLWIESQSGGWATAETEA